MKRYLKNMVPIGTIDKNPVYFGGGSAASIKRTRTRTRAMMTAISDKIRSVDQVFVVGHKNLDMDALGSAVGMKLFASNVTENSYALYDENQMSPDIERAVSFLEKEGVTKLLSVKDAMGMVTNRSLLILVDHSKTALTLSKDFFAMISFKALAKACSVKLFIRPPVLHLLYHNHWKPDCYFIVDKRIVLISPKNIIVSNY